MSGRPGLQSCPLCASGEPEHVSSDVLGPGLWLYSCNNTGKYHAEAFTWESEGTVPLRDTGHVGLSEELDIYADLMVVLQRIDRFAEHGVIEYEYARESPDAYRTLIDRYSHTELGAKSYTASSFIGSALGRIWARDEVIYRLVPATGRWAYNHRISAWALPGAESSTVLTWAEFAPTAGVNPNLWPLDVLLA